MTVPIALMSCLLVFCLEKQSESDEFDPTEDMMYRLKAVDVNGLNEKDWSIIFKRTCILINQA
jgi:hypothetical protein